MMNLRGASIDNFDKLKGELQTVYDAELPKTGSQRAVIEAECAKALEQAAEKVAKLQEAKQAQEQKKAEEEERRKQVADKSEKLLDEFFTLAEGAEEAKKTLQEAADSITSSEKMSKLSEAEITRTAATVESLAAAAKTRLEATTEFKTQNQVDMMSGSRLPGNPLKEKTDQFA